MSFDLLRERGRQALERIASEVDLREPLVASAWLASTARNAARAEALIAHVASREPGHVRTESRYRFELSHRVGVPTPFYAPPDVWTPWHPSDGSAFERDRFAQEEWLVQPAAVVGHLAVFARQGADELFDEALRVLRRDLAQAALGDAPFTDTFLLRAVTRAPEVLRALEPVAFAVTSAYAASDAAPVLGVRFPYATKPLTSATAALADALLSQGAYLELLAAQVRWLETARREDGGFGDADEPSDPWTTALAANVLSALDPAHDFDRTLSHLAAAQRDDGTWAAIGPDAPVTTAEVLSLFDAAERGFSERFRWPRVPAGHRDRKTGLPSFAHFLELVELLSHVGTLATVATELAFIDLIGFRAFNNHHGKTWATRCSKPSPRPSTNCPEAARFVTVATSSCSSAHRARKACRPASKLFCRPGRRAFVRALATPRRSPLACSSPPAPRTRYAPRASARAARSPKPRSARATRASASCFRATKRATTRIPERVLRA
ncbi:MAG: hypothetical protein H6723_01460 [Sandaracinus sp.]|nr:hypothetical protein [Sandaracinus sp.]